ncbi:glycosyl transferase [Halarcobacter mediterraneus]|uniref:Glycosyl transferase n=1 Tax=Halarcobacter mediterraneus TaxID=2023153 RepID=A0A4Q1AWA2_9BACT|nr:glycosyltransferase family 4 protein [Halarcobacter mediterraneus]RXK12282.1 glycosyl transferase [Halarcobacter mediterraneus]
MRILIPSIQVPFISGGSILMTQGLKNALIKAGHEVEVVTIPFKFSPHSYIEDLIEFWKKQDFNNFNGFHIDMVIVLQFPAYYVQHKNKVLWLMHQHRSVYELYNEEKALEEDKQLKELIVKSDTQELALIKSRFSMCQNVSNRLMKYNNISSIPLYHPPFREEKFYCEESYDFIFCPSRLEELKRQDLLIQAMQYTKTNVVAIIAGTGGQKENYEKQIKSLKLVDKVKLIGHISDEEKETFYARSLGVFFAPFDEDYGYITLEAMLSSKPLITCIDSGGPLEFVINDETGFILEPNPKEIAEKIDYLYQNKQKAKEMGIKALKHYKSKNISWNNVVNKILGSK